MRYVNWEEVEKLSGEIAERAGAFSKPDYVVGITMGGIIPAALVAEALDIKNFITVSCESYHNKAKQKLKITYLPKIDLKGKSVLLVDEIADTGSTLKELVEIFVSQYKVGSITTATLFKNSKNCTYEPDIFGAETDEWVVFPWDSKAE